MNVVRPTGDHDILDDEFQLVISHGRGNTEYAEVHITVMNHGTVVSQGWYRTRELEAAIWQSLPPKPGAMRVTEGQIAA